jgi:hypothetical protein
MQEYLNDIAARFALLNHTLPRTGSLTPEQLKLRLDKLEQSPLLLNQYGEQLQAVFSALEYIKKNAKQQGAKVYICFVVFEKIQQALIQKRAEIQEDCARNQQLLQQMQQNAVFQAQCGPLEQRLLERQGFLRMLGIFEEQVVRARGSTRELEASANQLILNSEQGSLVIFKAMEMNLPPDAVLGMTRELDYVCKRVDDLKTRIDKLEAQVHQALAESYRLSLPLPDLPG